MLSRSPITPICAWFALTLTVGCQNDPAPAVPASPDRGALDMATLDARMNDAERLDATIADAARDADVDAQPIDMAVDMALADADPRSLADVWAPDFGPPPDDMPEEIRWMHGRMWCPEPRPDRTMPDGTSECAFVDEPTPRDQLNPPGTPNAIIACYGWPHRTSDAQWADGDGYPPYVSCNPDRTVCCSFLPTRLTPCGWTTCGGVWSHQYTEGNAEQGGRWLEERGLQVSLPAPVECPADMLDAFPQALNNCHHECKAPACE